MMCIQEKQKKNTGDEGPINWYISMILVEKATAKMFINSKRLITRLHHKTLALSLLLFFPSSKMKLTCDFSLLPWRMSLEGRALYWPFLSFSMRYVYRDLLSIVYHQAFTWEIACIVAAPKYRVDIDC